MEQRESFWRGLPAGHEPPSVITLAGCGAGGTVVAFASRGKERTGQLGCGGELYAIYLRQEAQRKGLEALLVRQLMHELAAREEKLA